MYNEILKYQEIDSKIVELEKAFATSPERRAVSKARNILTEFDNGKTDMNNKAKTLQTAFEKISSLTEELSKELAEYQTQLEKTTGEDEINYFIKKITQLETQINKCEKEMSDLYTGIKDLLMAYDELRKKAQTAKATYEQNKPAYDALRKTKTEQVEVISKELEAIEKTIAPELLAKYKKVRGKKIFPVIVPINGNRCTGCQMENALNKLSEIDTNGITECEECGRLMFKEI